MWSSRNLAGPSRSVSTIMSPASYVMRRTRLPELRRPAALLVALVIVQITLGALTILSRRDVWINSFHVVCGALVLTTSLVITLRAWRTSLRIADCGSRIADGGLLKARCQPAKQAAKSTNQNPVCANRNPQSAIRNPQSAILNPQ